MSAALAWLEGLSLPALLGLLSTLNALMYLASWGGVAALRRALPEADLNRGRARITPQEVGISAAVVALNIALGAPGWWLWKHGYLTLLAEGWGRMALDTAYLFVTFDLAMYALHRAAHLPSLYTHIHARHHHHVHVDGLSLYVMHPAEALGFGALLLAALVGHPVHLGALALFLFFNWVYGTVGHSGLRITHPLARWLAGDSAFHHGHHAEGRGNYGFFTPVWDRMFGTLLPPDPPGR